MPYYGDNSPYYYGSNSFSNHSSLMTGVSSSRNYNTPSKSRYSPHLSTISESSLINLRRYPTATSSTATAAATRPHRIIDTADIDVTKKPSRLHLDLNNDSKNKNQRLSRDRATIKIRSQALKDNPALREYNEKHEKNIGELLVQKFLIKDNDHDYNRLKLYHQPSLLTSNNKDNTDNVDELEKEAMMALTHKIIRRMTRRRSSADATSIMLDPERIEREAAYAQVQAEVLDSLVAEEQAELEVETRKGAFVKRPAMRLTPEIVTETDGEETDIEDSEVNENAKKKTVKRKRRRRSASSITLIDDVSEGSQSDDEAEADDEVKPNLLTVEKSPEKIVEPKIEEKSVIKEKKSPKNKIIKTKKVVSSSNKKEDTLKTPGFKVEACNSVGDFSTLYVKAGTGPNERKQSVVEQYRESIRLPAPKILEHISTEIVIPARKPYIKDTSRNSVHLAVKPIKKLDDNDTCQKLNSKIGSSSSSSLISSSIEKKIPAKKDVTQSNKLESQSTNIYEGIGKESNSLDNIYSNKINEDNKNDYLNVPNFNFNNEDSDKNSDDTIEDIWADRNEDDFISRKKSRSNLSLDKLDVFDKIPEEDEDVDKNKDKNDTKNINDLKVVDNIDPKKKIIVGFLGKVIGKNEAPVETKEIPKTEVDNKKTETQKKEEKTMSSKLEKKIEVPKNVMKIPEVTTINRPSSPSRFKLTPRNSLTTVKEETENVIPKKRNEIKKINSEAIMKVEKKILDDADCQRNIKLKKFNDQKNDDKKISLVKDNLNKQVDILAEVKEEKDNLIKKSDTIKSTEVDFWSEIQAEKSEKLTETEAKSPKPSKTNKAEVQNEKLIPQDNINDSKKLFEIIDKIDNKKSIIENNKPENKIVTAISKLDLSHIPQSLDDSDFASSEVSTPFLSEPPSPFINDDNKNLSPFTIDDKNLSPLSDQEIPLLQSGKSSISLNNEDDPLIELSSTVKKNKMSKWSKQENLANFNEDESQVVTPVDSRTTSITSTPQDSMTSTPTKKKKIIKKKKSTTSSTTTSTNTTTGNKKKSVKKDGTTKTTKKKKSKAAPSPQTTLLKSPASNSSARNQPSQRPTDLIKMFYTTPSLLLTATPRDLRKVRRVKIKKKKEHSRKTSLNSDSTGSTRTSTGTTSTDEVSNYEEDVDQKRLASTRSNDSGFDGSPRISTPSQSSNIQPKVEENTEQFQHTGRITPPATNLPRFKKYEVTDFNFLKVLGKGSFGKVLLAELRGTECVYAVKCLKKDVVLEDDDVECTLIERKVLTLATRHPYLCHLFCTFQTDSHLFFVMEYLNGGDLMFHIQKSGRFSEPRAKFYAAEIWSGLIFLHKKGIVYRDLKLDNVLLDFEGHIRIADFGMCKLQIFLDRTADTFCGTPDYMAPEIIRGLKYNQAVDWWSFGVLLYEMLTGQSPFSGCDEDELFWSICNERPFIPRYLGQSSTEILVALLEKDAGKRIPGHEIACHTFFATIPWEKLERRCIEPPFKPAVEHTLDTRYFDTAFTAERPRLTPVPEQILTSMDQTVFRGFSYTNPNATD